MEHESFAERRKMFAAIPVMGKQRPGSTGNSSSNTESSSNSSASKDRSISGSLTEQTSELSRIKSDTKQSSFSEETSSHNATLARVIQQGAMNCTGPKKIPPPIPASRPLIRDRGVSDPSSVTLDKMLPSQCMFYDMDKTNLHYRRIDPQTIVYPKIQPIQPTITIDELNILQQYLNI